MCDLMCAEAATHGSTAGEFWQMSDDLQDLLTRMVEVVTRTMRMDEQAVRARGAPDVHPYTLPSGVDRKSPTAFETFLWVSCVYAARHLCETRASTVTLMLLCVELNPCRLHVVLLS